MIFDQHRYDVRCEWGINGVAQLLADSDAIAIVDVLSFSTCVDIAVSRGAILYPYRWQDASAADYAQSLSALLASAREDRGGFSLSPASLLAIPAGTRLVLPSPNGATLSLATQNVPTFVGCLRNSEAAARALQTFGSRISVIPAGERWPDGSLRPALEDLVGAGAIIHYLSGARSPEAQAAEAAFLHFRSNLTALREIASAKELIARGFPDDVTLALAFNQSVRVPILKDGAYMRYNP